MYYKKDTNVASQIFGYQIWFCIRLINMIKKFKPKSCTSVYTSLYTRYTVLVDNSSYYHDYRNIKCKHISYLLIEKQVAGEAN